MALKKYKISGRPKNFPGFPTGHPEPPERTEGDEGFLGQSVVEYAILTAIAIIALIISTNFISGLKDNAFENHFQTASWYIGGVLPQE